jgi:hypothetical protein
MLVVHLCKTRCPVHLPKRPALSLVSDARPGAHAQTAGDTPCTAAAPTASPAAPPCVGVGGWVFLTPHQAGSRTFDSSCLFATLQTCCCRHWALCTSQCELQQAQIVALPCTTPTGTDTAHPPPATTLYAQVTWLAQLQVLERRSNSSPDWQLM